MSLVDQLRLALEPVSSDPVAFWAGVKNYSLLWYGDDSDDAKEETKIFSKLASFVLGRLTLAHSTASVERVLSAVAFAKSRLGYRLSVAALEAVLRCRLYLKKRGQCCKQLEPSAAMLALYSEQIEDDDRREEKQNAASTSTADDHVVAMEQDQEEEDNYFLIACLPPVEDTM